MTQVRPVRDKPGTSAGTTGDRRSLFTGVTNCKEVRLELPEAILPPTKRACHRIKLTWRQVELRLRVIESLQMTAGGT